MKIDYLKLKEDLARLRNGQTSLAIFGADSHDFIVNDPLDEATIKSFETSYNIHLPADYRQFLREVGNGGAGPYYGLFKLGEMDDGWDYAPWSEIEGFLGILSKPFPHTEPWNDLTGQPAESLEDEDEDEDEDEYEQASEIFDEKYYSSANVNGAIPICHLGCARRQWLIVTGPETGNVWCDERTYYKGLYPLQKEGLSRVTFYQWYRDWLDESLSLLTS